MVHEGTADDGRTDEPDAPAGPTEAAWEPGLPPLRAVVPSVVGGAVVPLGVYYLVRSHVGSDASALAIAGVPAAAWVGLQFLRRRRIDPIGVVVLFGFATGLLVSFAMGGNAFVLKVRDSGFTFLFGLASVLSGFVAGRPLTFFVGRALSAGSDPIRARAYDELWQLPPARATFRMINFAWGIGLMCDAATRVVLAAELTTRSFLAVSPVVGGAYIGSMALFTVWIVGRSRHRAPLVGPAPPDGGSTWWWLRAYLRPIPVASSGRPPGE